ncbi:hypothetical protein EGM97_23490 [Pseudomonas sp. AF32]|nr:hypothetical protein [Pseudomonas sp. AF32]
MPKRELCQQGNRCDAYREQARSHSGSGYRKCCARRRNPCGSGLARESGGSVNEDAGWKIAFASKPAPTVDRGAVHLEPLWERACSR